MEIYVSMVLSSSFLVFHKSLLLLSGWLTALYSLSCNQLVMLYCTLTVPCHTLVHSTPTIHRNACMDGFCFTRCLTFPPFCVKLISEPILKTVTPRRKFWPQKLLNYNVKLDFESIMSSLRMDFEKEWIFN